MDGMLTHTLGDMLREAIRAEMGDKLDELRRFVDRRIAELSHEINATVQLMDYSEANLSGQLARIHEQIGSVLAAPAAGARNSGLELEAVVQVTESAANQIMEAAEAIGDWLQSNQDGSKDLDAVTQRINTIFEACSFQDLTSQRIRRAIAHLQQVDSMLAGLAPQAVEMAEQLHQPGLTPVGGSGHDLEQNAVDALFD